MSRASQVLAQVLTAIERSNDRFPTDDFATEVVDSWVENDDTFCIVYRQRLYGDELFGLRRTVEPAWSISGVVDEVLTCELFEPLGSLYDPMVADEQGIKWWAGNLSDWKGPPR